MAHVDDNGFLQSPFYRVATRAIILNAQQRILVVQNHAGEYELPGGGWEHNESFEECVRREIQEEVDASVASIGPLLFVYRGEPSAHKYWMLRLVVVVVLQHDARRPGPDMQAVRYVDKATFMHLPWGDEDRELLEHMDKLWGAVEKDGANR